MARLSYMVLLVAWPWLGYLLHRLMMGPSHHRSTSLHQHQAQEPSSAVQQHQMAAAQRAVARQAAFFVTHGGGPLPVLGDPSHKQLTSFLKSASKLLPQKPEAILCVTAHWEAPVTTVSTNPAPGMLYDYGGFPEEAYQLQYKAPGSPQLAERVINLLRDNGIDVQADNKRGYDHGTFIPLMLLFPAADIPVVQVSVMSHMDPAQHVRVGQALGQLRDDNILVLGSGSAFHNMKGFMMAMSGRPDPSMTQAAQAFDDYLQHACCQVTPEERLQLLKKWQDAPGARLCHPREEHLIPLHVVAGAAGNDPGSAHQDTAMGFPFSHFIFQA